MYGWLWGGRRSSVGALSHFPVLQGDSQLQHAGGRRGAAAAPAGRASASSARRAACGCGARRAACARAGRRALGGGSVARAARGRSSLASLRRAARAASPLCRTTRPLGASRGPRARPASLLLLAAWLAAATADLACPQEPPAAQVVCASCRSYENAREYSLRVIRESLLAKLGFAQAPNTTGRQLPRVPADLMERFERRPPPAGVQADAPALSRTFVTHTEQDDFLARTDNVLIFAR